MTELERIIAEHDIEKEEQLIAKIVDVLNSTEFMIEWASSVNVSLGDCFLKWYSYKAI